MFRTRIFSMLAALCCLCALALPAAAAEVDCDSVYCFSTEDFSQEDALAGVCITQLPDADLGTAMLGTRILRPGDILTADQLAQMTFAPLRSEEDRAAQVSYLPIYPDRVAEETTMTISIRGKEDKAPVAEDFAIETYKNLPNTGSLKVSDPEGQTMTFTVTRQPKRGELTVNADGTFTYTPKKNKVGIDSFTYTAADPAGNVSREATVTVNILKPTDAKQYTDTIGKDCRFAAEWMKNTGIFVGENLAGSACFSPEREVTRGEFVTMLVKALEIPTDEAVLYTGYTDVPAWLQPYLAAAVRSGLTAGIPARETFGAEEAITGAEAAVMLQNALDLTVSTAAYEETLPEWAAPALTVMAENGILLEADVSLPRAQTAEILYRATQLAASAPGMETLRAQG